MNPRQEPPALCPASLAARDKRGGNYGHDGHGHPFRDVLPAFFAASGPCAACPFAHIVIKACRCPPSAPPRVTAPDAALMPSCTGRSAILPAGHAKAHPSHARKQAPRSTRYRGSSRRTVTANQTIFPQSSRCGANIPG